MRRPVSDQQNQVFANQLLGIFRQQFDIHFTRFFRLCFSFLFFLLLSNGFLSVQGLFLSRFFLGSFFLPPNPASYSIHDVIVQPLIS